MFKPARRTRRGRTSVIEMGILAVQIALLAGTLWKTAKRLRRTVGWYNAIRGEGAASGRRNVVVVPRARRAR